MNIGILLAAGISGRFGGPVSKVLCKLHNKPIIKHSTDILCKYLDNVVVVTNKDCSRDIKKLFLKNKKIKVLVNHLGTRLDSIKVGLDFIASYDSDGISNVLIHDAARPFITPQTIEALLVSANSCSYSQYYLKLVNGLVQKTMESYDVVDREKYIELCTPQIIEYHLFNFLFRKYIYPKNRISCEILPLLNKFNISFNLIEGNQRYLRKITTIDDVY